MSRKGVALTERERDVVRLIRADLPYKAIAHELGIAESTARVYGSSALRKLKRTRLALVTSKQTRRQMTAN